LSNAGTGVLSVRYLAGIDIGGTKCATVLGACEENRIEIIEKIRFETPSTPEETLNRFSHELSALLDKTGIDIEGIGISCGGPLDSRKGLIHSPPNLPGWDNVPVVAFFEERFKKPAALQNDANACALAEYLYGAGRKVENMIFLTFGTGLGAGLILNGQLYSGTNDMAGEVGHIRLAENGPAGYGKKGSFEGFCSGGGIARFAEPLIKKHLSKGLTTKILEFSESDKSITAKSIGLAARAGDKLAREILEKTGTWLGKGLSLLIDILNPQLIVIGSIYTRQEEFLKKAALAVIERETLSHSRAVCSLVPSALGEEIGDYAALSVAGEYLSRSKQD
jgi:glucokinase